MMDDLAFSDEILLEEDSVERTETPEEVLSKFDLFRWERYDWSQFNPETYGYNVIRLMGNENNNRRKSEHSGVYFTIVDPYYHSYFTANDLRWYPLVEYHRDKNRGGEKAEQIKRIVAHRNNGPRRKRKVQYMHRLIAGAEGFQVGDHVNGLPLDNRGCNLRPVSYAVNNANRIYLRPIYGTLLPGVWWTDRTHQRVRGCVKLGGVRYNSETIWPLAEQELAHDWYIAKRKELFGENRWVNIGEPDYPQFPPERPIFRPGYIQESIEALAATF